MKVNIQLNNYKIKSIRWYKNHFVTTGLAFYGEVWTRKQYFFIPKELQKETKETILKHFKENPLKFETGGWYEYTRKP